MIDVVENVEPGDRRNDASIDVAKTAWIWARAEFRRFRSVGDCGLENPASMHSNPSAGENSKILRSLAISTATTHGMAKCSKQALE